MGSGPYLSQVCVFLIYFSAYISVLTSPAPACAGEFGYHGPRVVSAGTRHESKTSRSV